MVAIFFFCILPIVFIFVAAIGASIIQIGMNQMEDKEIFKEYEDNY